MNRNQRIHIRPVAVSREPSVVSRQSSVVSRQSSVVSRQSSVSGFLSTQEASGGIHSCQGR